MNNAGLPGDFYYFEDLLSEDERPILLRLREFLRAEVVPYANDWWLRGEFPLSIVKGYAELGIAGLSYPEGPDTRPSSLLSGFLALEMAHADPSEELASIAEAMIELGARIDTPDQNGWTALHRVAAHGDTALVGRLLRAGADASLTTAHGLTPGDIAANNGRLEMAQLLRDAERCE